MTRISGHVSNDDPRHYVFERNSRLPLDTFRRPRASADAVVFIVCALAFVVVALLIP